MKPTKAIPSLSLFLPLLLPALIFSACDERNHRMSFPAMGTIINLTFTCPDGKVRQIYGSVRSEVLRLEALMSPYKSDSDIRRLNEAGFLGPVEVASETYKLMERSAEISSLTNGAFDISFVPLARLWNYRDKNFSPPDAKAISAAKRLVDYRRITMHGGSRISLEKGMEVSLGGIAKGYAVDISVSLMQKLGASAGIADAGGNLKLFGNSGKKLIGVRHPRENTVICAVELNDGEAVSTSGDYERYVMYEGKRFHHIISPATGRPAEGTASVTVICKSAETADAASTALFVLNANNRRALLEKMPQWAVIIIDTSMNVYASHSLKHRISFSKGRQAVWL